MLRKQVQDLQNWYTSKRRKPLVIWGARQVGKSYLVEELFLKNNFEDYVYIDLAKDVEASSFFKSTHDPKQYLSYIESRYGKKISNDVPLAFDEVQSCFDVLTTLKYFNQDYPELPVIATGSMVRLALEKKNESFLFPVGKIDDMHVYPLTFDEYLLNANKVLLDKIVEAYNKKVALTVFDHELAMNYLYEFLAIGGMPEVVNEFINSKSYVDASTIRKTLFDNYLEDMATYNLSYESILKTRNVYTNIFSQLNKENKNFKVTLIQKGKSNRDYMNAYKWLELASVIYRSKKKEGKVTLPLVEEDEGLFRLYLSDPGLFAYESGTLNSNFFVKSNRNVLSGIFYENYVACEFVTNGIPLFYWCGKNNYEFEFLVENNEMIVPIDVKKGNGKLNSLIDFRLHNKTGLAIKIHGGNFGYDSSNQILSIPLYEVFLLASDIKNNNKLI